ncbi:hypothetical protein V8E54_006912 [Elaphomyces granulatus]
MFFGKIARVLKPLTLGVNGVNHLHPRTRGFSKNCIRALEIIQSKTHRSVPFGCGLEVNSATIRQLDLGPHKHGEGNTLQGNLEPRVFRLESLTLDTQEKVSNVGKENALLSSQLNTFEARFTGKLDTWAVSVNAELEKKFSPLQTQIAAMEVQTRTTHWVIIFGGFSLLFWLLKEFMKNVREHNNDHNDDHKECGEK